MLIDVLTRDRYDPDGMMDWNDGGMDGSGVLMMVLVTLLLVALVVALTVLLVRGTGAQSTPTATPAAPHTTAPREVLDLRLARGEITREEYAALRGDLGG